MVLLLELEPDKCIVRLTERTINVTTATGAPCIVQVGRPGSDDTCCIASVSTAFKRPCLSLHLHKLHEEHLVRLVHCVEQSIQEKISSATAGRHSAYAASGIVDISGQSGPALARIQRPQRILQRTASTRSVRVAGRGRTRLRKGWFQLGPHPLDTRSPVQTRRSGAHSNRNGGLRSAEVGGCGRGGVPRAALASSSPRTAARATSRAALASCSPRTAARATSRAARHGGTDNGRSPAKEERAQGAEEASQTRCGSRHGRR